jgi:serine/threonine protein kinase
MFDNTRPPHRKFGPYACTQLLGLSTNNSVYYAIHEETGKQVALRVMPIIKGDKEAVLAACQEQLASFSQISSPYVVPIEDYGHDQDSLYIALHVMKGGSLEARLRQHYEDADARPLPSLGEVGDLLLRLAAALDDIHHAEIVHGQVDPHNILFDEYGQAHLSDIGISRLHKLIYGLETTNSFHMSKYAAPELWDGHRPQPASDLYSLACITYELISGRAPFEAPTIYKLMQKHMNDVALPPHYIKQHLPQDLALAFWQALAKPPAKRQKSALEFYDDIQQAISGYEGEPTGFFTFDLQA